ncbi:MAG: Glycosyl transferase family 2 [Candidatus Daviesbacteria bacterium GW2011_GWB1_41_5]|uniref:Glycosyl transferase family 2 n=1 Tax=Candidatus Daviesbacteria bacterium GW2011_GWB1_41_5 TaxID=1618429 RepID=A0A0G0WJE4_9BACT|nr:MAG: Glycosyl transferase family 2 [Candidatus Daviesbacteria bacterium GW2011_GWB1_41_5]
MKPLVSVVILNWNGRAHLGKCLVSLGKATYKPFELIVVDNNSTDDSVFFIKQKFPHVRIIVNAINRGYSGGNNDGIAASRGKYICILNNDTEVEKHFLEPLVTAMEADRSVGCVQMLIRKSALDQIGIFDEDFFIYFEETDLCHRLWLSGYKVIYEPQSVIYHYEAVDTHKQMTNDFIMYLSYRNRIASFIKNLSCSSMLRLFPVLCVFYVISFALYPAAVFRAIMSTLWGLPKILKKRRAVQAQRKISDSVLFQTIWRDPPVLYYYYLFKSLKFYRHEPSLVEANRY